MSVDNQAVNAFAFDACEKLDKTWTNPGEGETVSPDDVLHFWDLKPQAPDPLSPGFVILEQPEGGQAIYGDSVPLMLAAQQWKRIPMFRKQDFDPGSGQVFGVALIAGVAAAGIAVRFDSGCVTTTTNDSNEFAFRVDLGAGIHFAEAFIVTPNPITGKQETFRTLQPLQFVVKKWEATRIELILEPPSDLWRIIDAHLDADIHDRSFWGGDADTHHFNDENDDRHFELRQDLEDDPRAPEEQRNTVLEHDELWRTEPEVGSGVHVAVAITARFDPADRSVQAHVDVALIDTDSGGFLGTGTSSDVDQLEQRDIVIPADQTVDELKDVDFSSDETVPEREYRCA